MAVLRDFKIIGRFAETAQTVIPTPPVSGVSYRDETITASDIQQGWPYSLIVDSAAYNQILYLYSGLLQDIDKSGVPGWSDKIDYTFGDWVRGSDGRTYRAEATSGPTSALKDPITPANRPQFWKDSAEIATEVAITNNVYTDTGAANAYVITPVSNSTDLKFPSSYNDLDGARVVFVPANNNTGNATINIGQNLGSLLGTRNLRRIGGASLAAGDLKAGLLAEAYFNGAANRWELTTWSQYVAQNTGAGPQPGTLEIYDEGGSVNNSATRINFTGAGVTATNAGGGVVNVNVPGVGTAGQVLKKELFSFTTPLYSTPTTTSDTLANYTSFFTTPLLGTPLASGVFVTDSAASTILLEWSFLMSAAQSRTFPVSGNIGDVGAIAIRVEVNGVIRGHSIHYIGGETYIPPSVQAEAYIFSTSATLAGAASVPSLGASTPHNVNIYYRVFTDPVAYPTCGLWINSIPISPSGLLTATPHQSSFIMATEVAN